MRPAWPVHTSNEKSVHWGDYQYDGSNGDDYKVLQVKLLPFSCRMSLRVVAIAAQFYFTIVSDMSVLYVTGIENDYEQLTGQSQQ